MASKTPLYNVKLQSSLNLNGQTALNNTKSKRFNPKSLGATNRTIDATDMGCFLSFTGTRTITINAGLTGVVAGDTFIASSDSLIFAGTSTRINGFSERNANSIVQFIYVGSNTWLIISLN